MDLQPSQLESLTSLDVLRASSSIPRASPRTFSLLTLSLIFPLSFAVLIHSLFTHPLLLHLQNSPSPSSSADFSLLFLYQFIYLLFLFLFSLLSTSAVVFTVASLHAAKPVSFSSSLSAIPPIFPRLFRTFLWVSLLVFLYNLAFALSFLLLLFAYPSSPDSPVFLIALSLLIIAFIAAHVMISAIWHLASVVSVLEPVCGLEAMRKARQLLRGRARMAAVLVAGYLSSCGIIGWAFRAFVVKGRTEEGSFGLGVAAKVLVGGGLVAVLVLVNFVGLLAQSVFYYVCKSFHHQAIDRSALYDHLGGYLGEYVPLKSSIQMENL